MDSVNTSLLLGNVEPRQTRLHRSDGVFPEVVEAGHFGHTGLLLR